MSTVKPLESAAWFTMGITTLNLLATQMFNVSSQNHRLDLRYSRIPKISKVLKTSSNWFHHEITSGSTDLHWSWSSYLHLAAKDASSSGTLLAWAASMLMAVALLV